MVKSFVVAPEYWPPSVTSVNVVPLSLLSCHWKALPVDTTLNVAFCPINSDWSEGGVLIITNVCAFVTSVFVPV